MTDGVLGASFRDPSGFVFERDGVLYRQINRSYGPHYDQLMSSGLYAELNGSGLLIPHEEVAKIDSPDGDPYLTIRPQRVAFVSYPYEWCFSQLRDAALATLRVQRAALRFGMTLKDASAYNIQFHEGRPTLIDTLSFEEYREGSPWVGYRQFCQHFLAPLALMAYRDVRLARLLRAHLDGVPLDLTRALLPARAWLNVHLLLHVRVHARYQSRYQADAEAAAKARPLSKRSFGNLLTALESAVSKLKWKPEGSEWADYGSGDSYSAASAEHKRALVSEYLEALAPREIWDLGANTGEFSRIASDRGIRTVAFDIDPACVERNYRQVRRDAETRLLPLVLDLANPSPALGWAHDERASLLERRSADAVMALALVHHLAIANNLPLPRVAAFFAELAESLIVEFVPKSDPKVRILLATRRDIFPDYAQEGFEAAFAPHFEIEAATPIADSERTLYRMRRRRDSARGPTSRLPPT
jgi:hypothetical protein